MNEIEKERLKWSTQYRDRQTVRDMQMRGKEEKERNGHSGYFKHFSIVLIHIKITV